MGARTINCWSVRDGGGSGTGSACRTIASVALSRTASPELFSTLADTIDMSGPVEHL
jgi:hypothetical protein